MPTKRPARRRRTLASLADRHDLYQKSVQSSEADLAFYERVFTAEYGRSPRTLREDFCGTAMVCAAWAESREDRTAIGIDLDESVLAWGTTHNLDPLAPAVRRRVRLVSQDVRTVKTPPADLVTAGNFSFCTFRDREGLLAYFRSARRGLGREGMLVMDVLGGYECYQENRLEKRKKRGFVYEWEQTRFDPIEHRGKFAIHFSFPDGSRIDRAFTYDWRLWTLPEIRELLGEAGFSRSDVYWESYDRKTGKGNGVFRKRTHAPAEAVWIGVIVAVA